MLAGAALLMLVPSMAHAQVVRGVVRDATTKAPLEGTTLTLLTLSDSVVGTAVSNDAGEFSLHAPDAGTYRIRLRRIGYKQAVSPRTRLRIAETVIVDLALAPVASRLQPVRVTERNRLTRGRDLMAFRESFGKGVFLRQTEIQELGGERLSDVLSKVEGMRVDHFPRGTYALRRSEHRGHRMGDNEVLISTKGFGCLHVLLNGGDLRTFENVLASEERPIWLNELLPPGEIAGIEIYADFQEVPRELRARAWPPSQLALFNGLGSSVPCGLVFIWTHAAW
jgi:hypothetical protein